MSTFSHCNGPGCNSCGEITPPVLSQLKQELESLKQSFNQLNEKLSKYPNIESTDIGNATIKTLTVLEKLIGASAIITANAINVTGSIKAGANIEALNAILEDKVKAAKLEVGQITNKGDSKLEGNLTVLGNSILKELQATTALLEELTINKTLTVKDSARIEKTLEVLEKIISKGTLDVAQKLRAGALDVSGISVLQNVVGAAATFNSLILNATLEVLGNTKLKDLATDNITNEHDIQTLTATIRASLITNSIISNEPVAKNLLSYTHGTTIKLYHLCQNIPDQPPYYLGGNENAHFTFYAEKYKDLITTKYFYTEQGRREVLTGMTALVLKKDERLDPAALEDIAGIYEATVTGDTVTWTLKTNVVAPSKHNTDGWKFHIEFIKMPDTSNESYAHEFVLVWLPYLADTNMVDVGHQDYNLTLHSQTRPNVNEYGALHKVAYLSDLVNSILYQGGATYYVEDVSKLPAVGTDLPISADLSKVRKVVNGDTAVVIAPTEDKVAAYYKLEKDSWIEYGKLEHTAHYAYQWNIDYVKEGTDTYWHEASVIWAPSSEQAIKVSIINLPLEDYYNIAQIEEIKKTLILLATTQTNWLDRRRVIIRDGVMYDNPAYLINKPVTGVSLLDGGNWDNGYPHPQFVVYGGNFDDLEVSAKHILDADNEYQNCIIRVMHGNKASLPDAREETKNTLKWCDDTGELFLDCFELQNDKTLQTSLTGGNFLIRSKDELRFLATLLWEPDSANATAVLNKLVSLRNTEFPVDEEATKTNTIIYKGVRGDNGKLYPFSYELKGSDRVRFKKTTTSEPYDNISDSDVDYFKRDRDIIIDVVVDDIIAYIKDNDRRITQLEDLDTRWKPDDSNAAEIKDIAEYRGQKFEVDESVDKTNKCKVYGTRIKNGTSEVENFEYPITLGKRIRVNKTVGDDPEIIVDIVIDDLLAHADMLAKRTRALEDLDVRYSAGDTDAVEIDDGFTVVPADNTKTNICKVAGTRINNTTGEVEAFEYNIICDKRIRISKDNDNINITLVFSDIIDTIKANKTAIDTERQERIDADNALIKPEVIKFDDFGINLIPDIIGIQFTQIVRTGNIINAYIYCKLKNDVPAPANEFIQLKDKYNPIIQTVYPIIPDTTYGAYVILHTDSNISLFIYNKDIFNNHKPVFHINLVYVLKE